MTSAAHVIEDLCFDIDFGSEDEAFEAQERLMRFAQGRAQQVIAEVFDEAIEPGAILRLEKLEVDIGTLAAIDFEDRFAERLREELRTLLRDRRVEVGQSDDLAPCSVERRALELCSRPPVSGDDSQSESLRVGHLTTGARAELDWLLHFIEQGCLPWHAPAHIGRDMPALAARVLEDNGVQLARALRAAPVARWRTIFRRLVAQFPTEWLAGLGRQIALARRHSSGAPAVEKIGLTGTAADLTGDTRGLPLPIAPVRALHGGAGAGLLQSSAAFDRDPVDVAPDPAAHPASDPAAHPAPDPADHLAPDAAARVGTPLEASHSIAAVSRYTLSGTEIPQATNTGVRDDLPEALARSQSRAQIVALLGEAPESDLALGVSVTVAPDTWRTMLRDDAPWLKDTLLRVGRGVRARRRLAAVLPEEVIPDLLALWLSPTQVDIVLATMGAGTGSFIREPSNVAVPREAIGAPGLLATLTYILVDGGAREFSESGYRHSLANQMARDGDEALRREGKFVSLTPGSRSNADLRPQNDRYRDLERWVDTLPEGRAMPLAPTWRSHALTANLATDATGQATDAMGQAFALSQPAAVADRDVHPDIQLRSGAAITPDARPERSTTVQSYRDLTAAATPDSVERAAARSEILSEVELAVPAAAHFKANSEPAQHVAVHFQANSEPAQQAAHFQANSEPAQPAAHLQANSEPAQPAARFQVNSEPAQPAAHFQVNSEPAQPAAVHSLGNSKLTDVVAVSPGTSVDTEILRATNIPVPDDLHDTLARSRAHVQIEALLCEQPDFAFATSMTVASDTWRTVLRDDASWLKAILLRLGRSIRARRRLVAMLPEEVVPDLIALWLSPIQVDIVLATISGPASFTRQGSNTGGPPETVSAPGLLATLTYILVDGGAWEFSESEYRRSLANLTARDRDGALHGEEISASLIPAPRRSVDPQDKTRGAPPPPAAPRAAREATQARLLDNHTRSATDLAAHPATDAPAQALALSDSPAAAATLDSAGHVAAHSETLLEVNPVVPATARFQANSEPVQGAAHFQTNARPAQHTAHFHANSEPGQHTAHFHANSEPTQDAAHFQANSEPAQRAAHFQANSEPAQRAAHFHANSEPTQHAAHFQDNSEPTQHAAHFQANSEPVQHIAHFQANAEPTQHTAHFQANAEPTQHTAHFQANAEPTQRAAHFQANSEPTQHAAHVQANAEPAQRAARFQANSEPTKRAAHFQANSEPVQHTAHFQANAEPAQATTARFQATSKPADVAAVSPGTSDDPEILRATNALVPCDLHDTFARSRARVQIEAPLCDSTQSDVAFAAPMMVAPYIWRSVLRDDAPWLKDTLVRLGRSIRARRRLVAMLPEKVVPDLLALWLSPIQVDIVLATISGPASFTRDVSNTDVPPETISDSGLLATLTYILVDGGAWEFSESDYRRSLANPTARDRDEALFRERKFASPTLRPRSNTGSGLQNHRHEDLEHLSDTLPEGRATPLAPTSRSPDATANPATDASAQAFDLSDSSATADQDAHPNTQLPSGAATTLDALPERFTTVPSDTDLTAAATPESAACAADRSEILSVGEPAVPAAAHLQANPEPAQRAAAHLQANPESAQHASAHFQANSEPAQHAAAHLQANPESAQHAAAHLQANPESAQHASAHFQANSEPAQHAAAHLQANPESAQHAAAHFQANPESAQHAVAHLQANSEPAQHAAAHLQANPESAQHAAAHLQANPESAQHAAVGFQTDSKPAEVAAVIRGASGGPEIPRATNIQAPGDSRKSLANLLARGQPFEGGTTQLTEELGSPVAKESATVEFSHQLPGVPGAQNDSDVLSPTAVQPRDITDRDITSLRDTDARATQPAAQARPDAHIPPGSPPSAAQSRAVISNDARPAALPPALPESPPLPEPPAALTQLPDSTRSATLTAPGTDTSPYDDDLLRHLRGARTPSFPTNVLHRALRTLLDQRSATARHALLSALEYPRAAHRLAALLAGGDLPDVLQWLRPTDGAIALAVAARVTTRIQNTRGHISPPRGETRGLPLPIDESIEITRGLSSQAGGGTQVPHGLSSQPDDGTEVPHGLSSQADDGTQVPHGLSSQPDDGTEVPHGLSSQAGDGTEVPHGLSSQAGGGTQVPHGLSPRASGGTQVPQHVLSQINEGTEVPRGSPPPINDGTEIQRGLSYPTKDGTGINADVHDINTGPAVITRIAHEFLLTELFEEGRTLDPEPFARRLTAALHAALTPQAQSESTLPERALSSYFARPDARAVVNSSQIQAATLAEDDPVTQRIYIANAGIVIIGPYLPRLFSMLGLTNKGAFTALSSAHRAIHLIQYIVTQSTVTPEPMLVLNKILCGLPIAAPIPLEIDLRAQEQAAIDEMLTAIIAHWKAIGRTSIAGLRESFFQREGRLVRADDAWRLRVESKSFDMLLDRLPWGYTPVKYPWMKRVLHVDWR